MLEAKEVTHDHKGVGKLRPEKGQQNRKKKRTAGFSDISAATLNTTVFSVRTALLPKSCF